MNSGYTWALRQQKRDKNTRTPYYYEEKKARKRLSKRLRSIQTAGRYVHIMDEEMFDSVCAMIGSKDRRDKVMAHDIILSSKMGIGQINYFIKNHTKILLEGVPEAASTNEASFTFANTSQSFSTSSFSTI